MYYTADKGMIEKHFSEARQRRLDRIYTGISYLSALGLLVVTVWGIVIAAGMA